MNQIVEAFAKNGIKVPLKRRIWVWVQDYPGHTAKDIAATMQTSVDACGVELRAMVARGMLEGVRETRNVPSGRGGMGRRGILVYNTPAHMPAYELLNMQKKGAPPARKTAAVPTPLTLSALDRIAADTNFNPDTFVQDLTMREARDLYGYLGRVFK